MPRDGAQCRAGRTAPGFAGVSLVAPADVPTAEPEIPDVAGGSGPSRGVQRTLHGAACQAEELEPLVPLFQGGEQRPQPRRADPGIGREIQGNQRRASGEAPGHLQDVAVAQAVPGEREVAQGAALLRQVPAEGPGEGLGARPGDGAQLQPAQAAARQVAEEPPQPRRPQGVAGQGQRLQPGGSREGEGVGEAAGLQAQRGERGAGLQQQGQGPAAGVAQGVQAQVQLLQALEGAGGAGEPGQELPQPLGAEAVPGQVEEGEGRQGGQRGQQIGSRGVG